MQAAIQAREELSEAAKAVVAMRQAQNLDALEVAWKEFLKRIDRTWNKAEGHYYRSPKWHSWSEKYACLRTKDPLLLYLRQSRNVEEHSIEPIAIRQPSRLTLDGIPDASGHKALFIKEMRMENGHVYIDTGGTPAVMNFSPGHIRLVPVTQRGVTYQPPTMHMGRAVDSNDLLGIADLAFNFYKAFLEAADEKFITN